MSPLGARSVRRPADTGEDAELWVPLRSPVVLTVPFAIGEASRWHDAGQCLTVPSQEHPDSALDANGITASNRRSRFERGVLARRTRDDARWSSSVANCHISATAKLTQPRVLAGVSHALSTRAYRGAMRSITS
jgi:hypothetical protein